MSRRARKPRTNQLRDLLDAIGRREALHSPIGQHERSVLSATAALGENAVCFMGGRASDALRYKVQPELCRLPFPVCWFEFELSDGTSQWRACALASEIDGIRRIWVYSIERGRWCLYGGAQIDNWHEEPSGFIEGSAITGVARVASAVAGFLSALNCRNVAQVGHAPNAKRQRMRERQGKPPLFSYWTLQLGPASAAGPYQGGTHASPRVHLRRGHPRQYAPGQWTWVQPHAVGNAKRGMVHKDYDGTALSEQR